MESEINLEIIQNKVLFEKIHFQKDLFFELFTEIGNEFPQNMLIKIHPASKGSKVSQGSNLEKCPYQVLDLIRDFDNKNGFNIRVLNWWGHGLYMIVQVGKANHNLEAINKNLLLNNFYLSQHIRPFDYLQIFESSVLLDSENHKTHSKAIDVLITFKKIEISKTASVKKEILFLLHQLLDI
ncbi:hypothetical protein SAMN06295967_101126 [Belliella buryatensis]|uniref:Uncharacterized protein n=1 Tax=Belliella buryatensis TaxID=1500549 RepID=A0A239AI00_9BACT|nr:hypothetical protein [Belliella buryatensis]SNR94573.1 hypothetical protein SAMN06295967_101126 [Belliella buryatensis]